MKKTFTLLSILTLSVLAIFAQSEIPSGYESIYDVVSETALAPDTADAQATLKLLGPTSSWNADIYDFTDYRYIDIKLKYQPADTGKQVALRYYANGAIKVDFIDLPLGKDSTLIVRLELPDYARADDSIKFGGIWLYNGSTHWSFAYPGVPATQATIVEYVAIKKKTKIPDGWVSIYSLKPQYEKAPYIVDGDTNYQLLGPIEGWGQNQYLDITNYDTLAIKIRHHAADTGNIVVVRFSNVSDDGTWSVHLEAVTLPNDLPDTTHIIKFVIADHVDTDAKLNMGGMIFYNGTERGSTAKMPTTVEYVALHTVPVQGLTIKPADSLQSKNLPFTLSTKLNAVFIPKNATNQAVIWTSADENIATVDTTGLVTAKSLPGEVVITAKSVENTSFSADYTIKITGAKVDVTGIKLALDTVNVKILLNGSVDTAITPANASLKTVSWMISDTNIAVVDNSGLITGIKEGYAKLIVTTNDGGFKDSCIVNVVGYKEIPKGYVSLYTLEYNEVDVLKGLDTISTFPGADVPGWFDSDKDNTGSLLGTQYQWNRFNKYTNVSAYPELVVAATFDKKDVGKSIRFRYAFSTSSAEVEGGCVIKNRDVIIEQEEMLFIVDLDNDTADVEDLKHLCAIKFQDNPDRIEFVVDYVALKKTGSLSTETRLSEIQLNGKLLNNFTADITEYNVPLKNVSSLTVTATAMDIAADVAITNNGNIDLSSGSAKVEITVTAEDGVTKKVYTINLTSITGLDDIYESEMTIYPTISNGSFNIEFSQTPGIITVFDITGNVVMQKTASSLTEKISLEQGLFFVKLEREGVYKLVKVVSMY